MRNTVIGKPMDVLTALRLYSELCAIYDNKRVRLAVIATPTAVEKVVDNQADAEETLQWIEEYK